MTEQLEATAHLQFSTVNNHLFKVELSQASIEASTLLYLLLVWPWEGFNINN